MHIVWGGTKPWWSWWRLYLGRGWKGDIPTHDMKGQQEGQDVDGFMFIQLLLILKKRIQFFRKASLLTIWHGQRWVASEKNLWALMEKNRWLYSVWNLCWPISQNATFMATKNPVEAGNAMPPMVPPRLHQAPARRRWQSLVGPHLFQSPPVT